MKTPMLGLLLLPLCAGLADHAVAQQAQVTYRAPTKDIALLVDVSVSVKSDMSGHRDAQNIIKDIVTGRGFDAARYERWKVDTGRTDPALQTLFAGFLGLAPTPESAVIQPLASHGRSFLSLPIGRLSTVLNANSPKVVGLNIQRDLGMFVDEGYPRNEQMKDQSTCFWFGMARAAAILEQQSRDGYYLFVVSDEEDDPDYLKYGPKGHSDRDYNAYIGGPLSKEYPPDAIHASIERYFETRSGGRKSEQYVARSDFKQTMIARFVQRGQENNDKKIRIAWYAMRVVPEREVVMPPRRPEDPAPPPVASYVPPKVDSRLQILGGWQYDRKEAAYASPLVVWQVQNAEVGGWREFRSDAKLKNGKLVPVREDSLRHAMKPLQLPKTAVDAQELELSLSAGEAGDGSSPQKLRFDITVRPHSIFWLQVLAILSGIAAVAIFLLSWRNLRQTRVVRT